MIKAMLAPLYRSLSNMKLFRKVVLVLASLVLISASLLWFLTKLINPEQVRQYVDAQLTSLTGQPSHVEGSINWQVFPLPGLNLSAVTVGDENDNSQGYNLTISNLLFNLKITPLLRGKLVFSEIQANGFRITVNKDSLKAVNDLQNALVNKHDTTLHQRFAVERFLLRNGKINWKNKDRVIEISKLQFATSGLNFNQQQFPLQFKATFNISENQQSISKGRVQFKGNTRLSDDFLRNPFVNFHNLAIDGQLVILDLCYKQLRFTKISANSFLKKRVLSFNPLTVKFYNGESIGDLLYYSDNHKLLINQSGSGLDSTKLAYDLFGKKLISGSLDFSLHSESNLQQEDWLINSQANGVVTIKNGALESINLPKIIDNVSQKVNTKLDNKNNDLKDLLQNGQFNNPDYFKGSTPFKLLTMQQHLQQGKLIADTMVLQTNDLLVKGQGQLNLSDYALSGTLAASVINGHGNVALIQQLLGGSFPLLIQGYANTPVVLPNLKIINPLLTHVWLKSTLEKPIKLLQQVKAVLTP